MVEVLGRLDAEFSPVICPKCSESRAHRSHREGVKDRIYRLFEMIPYRCRACHARFYAYRAGERSSKLRTREERSIMHLRRQIRWRHNKRQLAAYLLATGVLMGILYMLLQQKVASE